MGGVECGGGVERAEQPGARPLLAGELLGERDAREVGAADGAVQEAAAAEHRRGVLEPVVVAHQEGLVVARVAGGGQYRHLQAPDRYDIAVADADPLELDRLVGRQQVVGAVAPRQAEGAGDVVVVQVGVGYRGDVDACLLGRGLDRRQVAWGIDDQPVRPVVHQVGAVPQGGDLQRDDLHARLPNQSRST